MGKILQEATVEVNSLDEKDYIFNTFDRRQKLKLCCTRCHSNFELGVSAFLKRTHLLCSNCFSKGTFRFKVKESLFFNELPKDREISGSQKIKFYCSNCNKLCEIPYKCYSTNKLCAHCGRSLHNRAGEKAVLDKRFETCKKTYGEDWKKELSKRAQKRMLEKYGVTSTMLSKELKEKVFETQKAKFGGWALADKDIHQKTILSGKENNSYSKGSFWRNKSEAELTEIIHKRSKRYTYKNEKFDSSWEVAFWIYCEDNNIKVEREKTILKYNKNGIEHNYIVDFTIGNDLYEIKSDFLLGSLEKEKLDCMLKNKVHIIGKKEIQKYIKYVNNKYGKNYIKDNFRNF